MKSKPTKSKRKRQPHFRWRGERLYFCIGGDTIAAWPMQDTFWKTVPRSNGKKNWEAGLRRWESEFNFLVEIVVGGRVPKSQADIRRMAILLRKALVRAEEGPRAKSATRQRKKLDGWLYGRKYPVNPPQVSNAPINRPSAFPTITP